MRRTESFFKQLRSYRSLYDWHSCIYSCYCCLHSFEPIVQLELPKLLIKKDIRTILRRNHIEYKADLLSTLDIDSFRPIRSTLVRKGFDSKLKSDGLSLLNSLDGLVTAHGNINNHIRATSSCTYAVSHMVRATTLSLWINKFPSIYHKWNSGEGVDKSDFYLNKHECVNHIREEWDFVVKWFSNTNIVSTFSDEDQQKMKKDYDIWEDYEFHLL